jgi:hypothetical protein
MSNPAIRAGVFHVSEAAALISVKDNFEMFDRLQK